MDQLIKRATCSKDAESYPESAYFQVKTLVGNIKRLGGP